jgi:hypothetical protein
MGRELDYKTMKALIGTFPDTGFAWELVHHFKLEDGVWEPYNGYGEILPAHGLRITVKAVQWP